MINETTIKVGDVVRVPGYGYPLYVSELSKGSAVLHPAWHDHKGNWHAMTSGFRLHTVLDSKVEKVNR